MNIDELTDELKADIKQTANDMHERFFQLLADYQFEFDGDEKLALLDHILSEVRAHQVRDNEVE